MRPKLDIDVPAGAHRALNFFAAQGFLGINASEVASYLIMRGLDDLCRAGMLPLNEENEHD